MVTNGTAGVTNGVDGGGGWRFNGRMLPVESSSAPAEFTPSPWRARFLLPYFLGWMLLGLWLGSESVISQRRDLHPPADWHVYTWELSSAVAMSVLALLVAGFENRFRITGPGVLRRLPLHLAASLVFSVAHVALMVWLRKLIYLIGGESYDFGNLIAGFFYEFRKDLISYAAIVLACALLRNVRERRSQQLRELELHQAVTDARLAHLTAQMQPHFIFNTLNAISNRMYEDVAAADRMLVALADLLRAAMARDGAERVAVDEDAHWLEAYCHLMAERQPGQLEIHIDIDDRARRALVPRLLLQPLVENAFRHGLRSGRGRLDVSVGVRDDRLCCRVEDDGAGVPDDIEPGLGLGNVRERLALLYPGHHALTIRPRRGGGTEVMVEIPLEWTDDAAPGHR